MYIFVYTYIYICIRVFMYTLLLRCLNAYDNSSHMRVYMRLLIFYAGFPCTHVCKDIVAYAMYS